MILSFIPPASGLSAADPSVTRELTIFSARLDISVSILQFDDVAGDAVLDEEADWDSYDQLTSQEKR